MVFSPEVERQMREVERKVRQQPSESIKVLCGLQVIGEGLAMALISYLVGPLSNGMALARLCVLVIAAVTVIYPVEDWIMEIAKLYQIDDRPYRRMLMTRPVWLAMALMFLIQMGLSLLIVIVQAGAAFAAIIGVLIYATYFACMRYATVQSVHEVGRENNQQDEE